ncbi:MAG: response regulator transcription factor [Bacteroidota bacterium]
MKKISVMIVDDHTLLRQTWATLLNFYGPYEVIANTGDGHAAIEAATTFQPDLVLLDINMSPLNGFDVMDAIKKISPATKVIGVSMHSQPGYAKKMMRRGARGYVTKNSTTNELITAMEKVMKGETYVCTEVKNLLTEEVMGDSAGAGISHLTEKELQIIDLMKLGFTTKAIAEQMKVATKTVETHKHNIYKKLNVKSSFALMNLVARMAI